MRRARVRAPGSVYDGKTGTAIRPEDGRRIARAHWEYWDVLLNMDAGDTVVGFMLSELEDIDPPSTPAKPYCAACPRNDDQEGCCVEGA